MYQNNPKADALKKLNVEHILGELCLPQYQAACKPADISLSRLDEMGISTNEPTLKELLESSGGIRISKVDIDNDGVDEIRLFETVGTAHCARSYFYKQDTYGRYHRMSGSYDVFASEGRFCGGWLSFVRYKGKGYVLEVYGPNEISDTEYIDTVWLGSGQDMRELCTFKRFNK